MAGKMTSCKSCGAEISAKGKVICTSCGRENKKPFYKRGWFIAICVLFVLGSLGNLGSTEEASTNPTPAPAVDATAQAETPATPAETAAPVEVKAPMVVKVDDLVGALEENALKASDTYKGQYVELTGILQNIDSGGAYFSLGVLSDKMTFSTVMCNIKSEHKDAVMNFTKDQRVTVVGTITDVGEVLGYSLKVETIK